MASTYTVNIGIEKPGTGDQSGTWGVTTNTNFDIIDQATNGVATVTLAAAGTSGSPNTLLINNGALSDGRNRFIEFNDGADLGATAYVQLDPNDAEKIVHIRNSLSASRSLILFQGTYNASNDFEVPNGADVLVKFDGGGAGATVTDVNVNLTPTKITTSNADINGGTIDGVTLGTNSAVTEAQVDNININGNTISSTDTNGDINLAPNGTGVVALSSTDLTFGDNDKAIFGAGSDLQIYHDGSNSYIQDDGTGNLRIRATDLTLEKNAGGEYYLQATADGAVRLYYDGNQKLVTTATGVDVTGTVTADGLTVDNAGVIRLNPSSGDDFLTIQQGGSQAVITADSTAGAGNLVFRTTSAGSDTDIMFLSNNGDISFYDSTGVTQGFYWDASTQRLGLGTTSPSNALTLNSAAGGASGLRITSTEGSGFRIRAESATTTMLNVDSGESMLFGAGGTERMRIDSVGNVGIGTDSPTTKVEVFSNGPPAASGNMNTGVAVASAAGSFAINIGADATAGYTWLNSAYINASSIASPMVFMTGAAERMRIDSSGNVGIGKTPSTALDVNGTVTATAFVGDGSGLTGLGGGFTSGTLMLFQQTAAPTGWTKQTTHNDKALRVVSGTAGSGGSTAFTTALGTPAVSGSVSLSGNISNTTLSTAQIPSHNHGFTEGVSGNNVAAAMRKQNTAGDQTNNQKILSAGGGGSHNHGHNFSGSLSSATTAINVQYVDLIIASKD